MSTPQMDSPPATRSREAAQRLFQKNLELEEARRKAAKLKIPSDQNAWSQMRENFEAILLEDHDFSEKHGIEYSLWQLHHRRIDEYRAHLSAASAAVHGGKVPSRPDRAKKIFSSFRSFLSEASGFYHDLIQKIRAKYGLPLGYFAEGPENQYILSNDQKKSAEVKKALLSCHRCLIFLGDLARYKGMYGEGDSSSRDYAAASSYYLQAASLWPSSGNPHHQLAILSICTDENEVMTIYRYFRSLAVENPLLTARDNLIVAFEKNRQKCSQLSMNLKTYPPKARTNGRGRGYAGAPAKIVKSDDVSINERELSIQDVFDTFCVRFIRLNGILYTRTSLETFAEIFSSSLADLSELLSSGPDEKLNFGGESADNGMFILRLVATLIFSAYNVSKESETQSYAGILQRSVILQNAFTAAFEFMGLILKRCTELHDAASSYLLPTILVFIEWLACHPDISSGVDLDIEEKQASARLSFWNHLISLMNRLLLTGLVASGEEEDACFFDMSRYDEGETGNRLALWEDFELRGFVPLAPAQLILDFSSNHSLVSGGRSKEKKSRVQRILAAGRTLTGVVTIDQKKIYFDSKMKKYVLSDHPPVLEDENMPSNSDIPQSNGISGQSTMQLPSEGEEDEVIVFKPTIAEKPSNSSDKSSDFDVVTPSVQNYSANWNNYLRLQLSSSIDPPMSTLPALSASVSSTYTNPLVGSAFQQPFQAAVSGGNLTTDILHQPLQHINPTSKWVMNQDTFFSDGLQSLRLTDDGVISHRGMWDGFSSMQSTFPSNPFAGPMVSDQVSVDSNWSKAGGPILSTGAGQNGVALSSSSTVSAAAWRAPVSRPVRRLGPPPGFNSVPSKQKPVDDVIPGMISKEQSSLVDDYGWLDGYSSGNSATLIGDPLNSASNNMPAGNSNHNGVLNFPFPGKQVPLLQQQQQQHYQQQQQQHYQQLQLQQQHLKPGNQQPGAGMDKAQPLWPNYYV